MQYAIGKALAVVAICFTVSGCVTGYNSTFMYTDTNFGVNLDTEPPTVDISVGRKEGTIQPTFEGGQTIPTLTSFRGDTTTQKGLELGAGQTFTGGEAAYVFATLYDEDTPEKNCDGNFERIYDGHQVLLTKKPKLPNHVPAMDDDGTVRPLVFGTDTGLGLKVSSSAQTPGIPSSIKFGYNRKELAFAPVSIRQKSNGVDGPEKQFYIADMPSLMATVDYGAQVTAATQEKKQEAQRASATTKGAAAPAPMAMFGTRVRYAQYFATGEAATNLAYQRQVRNALIERSDPIAKMVSDAKTIEFTSSALAIAKYNSSTSGSEKKRFRADITKWMQSQTPPIKMKIVDFLEDAALSRLHDRLKAHLISLKYPLQ